MHINRATIASSLIIGASALLLGGCSLFPQKTTNPEATPAPTTTTTGQFPLFDGLDSILDASGSAIATPSATTTKGGLVQGVSTPSATVKKTVTKTTTVTTSPLYTTSFDSWYIINYPGQSYEKELILENKSDQPIMYSVRAADRFSDSVPVSVNGSFEATGNMLPLSKETVKIKAFSDTDPAGFTTNVTVNFISQNNQILSTRTVKVTAYTAIGDRFYVDTDTPTDKADNQTYDATYRSLAAYPIRIQNRNQRELNFEAKIVSSEAQGKMAFSATHGIIKSGDWWDTDIHFLKPDTKVDQVTVEFTFTGTGDDPYRATKTLTLKFN